MFDWDSKKKWKEYISERNVSEKVARRSTSSIIKDSTWDPTNVQQFIEEFPIDAEPNTNTHS